jgi:hypothetical protein
MQFKDCYLEMYGVNVGPAPAHQGKSAYQRLKKLICELDDTDDDEDSISASALVAGTSRSSSLASIMVIPSLASIDPKKPWLKEFNYYLNTVDEIPNGLTVVKWWGVCVLFTVPFFRCMFSDIFGFYCSVGFQ